MNVTVEDLAPCKKLVRFEIEPKTVDETFANTTKEFVKHANFPGFRPGKAPEHMVAKKYEKEIQDEVKRKLMADSYQKALKEQKLDVVGYPDIEEIQFAAGQPFQFAATIETAPKFEMPEYRSLPAKRDATRVTDQDIEKALNALQLQQAKFETVDRPLKEGDFAVINYFGSCEGKPIRDWAPVARGLTEKKNFWLEIKQEAFIPGFGPQLVGAKAGDKRTVTVDFAPDFVTKEIAGKKGTFDVEVVEVKVRALPTLDDAFAKSYEAENIEALREGIRRDLQNELNTKQRAQIRNQLVEELLKRVNFELPESMVQAETRDVVYNIVSENQKRGVAKEVLDQQKESIYSAANAAAKDRVKADFLFGKIAEREG
ncbi:MAG TPA: trigger factor, partial [Verrucomicrobiae bacterium]|nr:trigger factor [Verrucomicrobiae bacterium]